MNQNEARLYRQLFSIPNSWKNVLYVHTPFCRQKCFYCVYGSKEPYDDGELDEFYLRQLPAQICQIRDILETVDFDQIYFGGGTPTIAAALTLERIFEQIPNFESISFKACEASPDTIDDGHIDLFSSHGFSYISLGVQTLSRRVLEAQNRPAVSPGRLMEICHSIEGRGIIVNLDLILFLDTGREKDLDSARDDLELLMGNIRPASITLHYNYHIQKSPDLRRAMMRLAEEMTLRFPDYSCVNSLLEEEDIAGDMLHSAAYRLMRTSKDLDYYMMPKIPWMHAYGHNMLALGEYRHFRVRYNYYYICDFIDKFTYGRVLERNREVAVDFDRIRLRLGLPVTGYSDREDFFVGQEGKREFKRIVTAANLPFHDLSRSR